MDNNKDQAQVNTPVDGGSDQGQKLQERIVELENNWKRALADYKNLERRTAEEKQEFAEFSNIILMQELSPEKIKI